MPSSMYGFPDGIILDRCVKPPVTVRGEKHWEVEVLSLLTPGLYIIVSIFCNKRKETGICICHIGLPGISFVRKKERVSLISVISRVGVSEPILNDISHDTRLFIYRLTDGFCRYVEIETFNRGMSYIELSNSIYNMPIIRYMPADRCVCGIFRYC